MLLAMGADPAGLDLIRQIREGKTVSAANLPIAVMTEDCDKTGLSTLIELKVMRVLLKPVKVRHLLEAAAAIAGNRSSGPGARLR
jgi:DNA-binding NarL/FixJ family response regulator